FPLNASGKLDRKALPAPTFAAKVFRAPTTAVQQAIASVFADVLGAERVGLDDDFFALGGNSLVATRIVARVNAALDGGLGVRDLFEAPSVAELALRAEAVAAGGRRPPLLARPRPEQVPLSLAQQRIWVINQLDPQSPAYNIPFAVRLTGALDVVALQRAVEDVLERHESLRTRYPESGPGGTPYQEIVSVSEALPGGLEVRAAGGELERVAELMSAGFDVTAQVPVRALLLTGADAPDEHVLAVVVHHISADGASMAPLARDLIMAYAARCAGDAPSWAPPPVQYADFALWQRSVVGTDDDENSVAARQLAYWREQLAEAVRTPRLPLDRPRPVAPSLRGASLGFSVPQDVHVGLVRIAREHNSSLFMVVHAGLSALLARLSGGSDITIGTPIAGRGERVLDDLVGMFVNTLALRTAVDLAGTFDALVEQARETDLSAFANADIPFERVVEVVAPDRANVQNPLFQVALSFQNTEQPTLQLPGLTVAGVDTGAVTAKFDLQVIVEPHSGADGVPAELLGALHYATDIFDEATMQAFGRRLQRVLAAVAADPQVRIGDIDILDAAERERVQSAPEPSAETATITRGTALPEMLTAAVEDDPEGPAWVFGEDAISYQELQARSSRLARVLITRGCGPGTGVAVRLDRGIESVVATWAIVATGAAVVPVAAAAELPSELEVMVGLVAGTPPAQARGVDWLVLDDPAVTAEIAAESPRPVTYANRTRDLLGTDPAFIGAGETLSYDELAAVVNRFCARTALTFESRTLRHGRPDALAAVVEVVAAGATGASIVAVLVASDAELPDVLAEEWVTHLLAERNGFEDLGRDSLAELRAVVLDDGPIADAATRLSWVDTVVALTDLR
ncbi:condensation domain-containing protein, partial [Nocardia sp. NPDC049707]|uniref:condensation domain-containing protein n=1 Tax=Nocardia sp. NPDC049707 TaxID=3154735 RepID=UPI0034277A39